jgi:hypothetical protein
MEVSYDRKHGLIDFTMAKGEDHFALNYDELMDILLEAYHKLIERKSK